MNKLILADCFDMMSIIILENITTSEILNWVYTSLLIVSILFGIVLKIIAAIKDRKITKEEIEDIKKEVDDGIQKLTNEKNKENK